MVDTNPYLSPEVSSADGEPPADDTISAEQAVDWIDRILVQTYSWQVGANLLGILLALVWVFALWGIIELMETAGRLLSVTLFIASFLVIGLADFLWRARRSHRVGLSRFALPFEGAAVAYLPVCIWMFGTLILFSVIAISRIIR